MFKRLMDRVSSMFKRLMDRVSSMFKRNKKKLKDEKVKEAVESEKENVNHSKSVRGWIWRDQIKQFGEHYLASGQHSTAKRKMKMRKGH